MLSIPLTWPVGQGVKTSPSHGENTSSILVLAARNFRSDSEVFFTFAKEKDIRSKTFSGTAPDILSYFYFILPHPPQVLPE